MTPAQMADKAEMLYRVGLGYGARGRAKQVAFEQIHAMMPEVIEALHRLQRLDDELVSIPHIDLRQIPMLVGRD